MQKFTRLMCAALALCLLAGCNASVEEETSSSSFSTTTATTTTSEAESTTASTSAASTSSSAVNFENIASSELYQAYYFMLFMVKEGHRLPDGFGDLEYDACYAEENQFVVCDVDGDGVDELVLEWCACEPEAQCTYVFEYETDTDEWNLELQTAGAAEFYDNGICEAYYIDPAGLYSSYSPYLIYSYSPETDTFESCGSVSALEKIACDEQGVDFPTSYDTDSAGVVFTIDYEGYSSDYYNLSEYLDFLGKLQGEYLPTPYMPLIDENLESEFRDR